MNILSYIKTKTNLLVLGLFFSITLWGQTADSLSVTGDKLELYKQSNLWLGTLNSAGNNLYPFLNYTDVSGGYTHTQGTFRQQQEGTKNNGFLFLAEGATDLKGAYLWGKFSLETEKKRNSRFNSSIIDPFRGMPFIIADGKSSDWRLQYYNLETKIAFPKLSDKLYTGLGVNYNVSTGAKQLDPRPLNRYYSLELSPSLIYAINANHKLGGVFYYKNMHETSNIDFKNAYQDATFYYLEGLGAFTETTGNSRKRDYRGNSFGGEMQYSVSYDYLNFMLSGGYIYDRENVIDGGGQIVNTSQALRDNYWGSMALNIERNGLKHSVMAELTHQNINGIFYDKVKDPNDPVVGQIVLYKKTRSEYKTTNYSLSYNLFKLNETGYLWNVGANLRHSDLKDTYLLPQPNVDVSTQSISRYDVAVHGKYNFNRNMPWHGQLLISSSVQYSLSNKGELNYGGGQEDHTVFKDLLYQDFLFLNKNYWKFNGEIKYTVPLSISNKSVNAYSKINAFLIPDTNLGKQSSVTITLGFIL